ncbi:nitroreductase/quinone reductase family protein [Streptoalloteichus hindustanus]|uniref:Deazaflavin-dependent oxidoreductase, nitroreductase family n=1 Tax=Streptoalloteichus hindustanus TaxID=2017 RepID=A0A1M5ADP3_STRHI|nr:nitroreductase/quinone reductase family protein [Streptoalloteichus hindustanus]SHF28388.1 deazaflavin-dependent oxidoreductase, nitroreductase family [Streptoalloteichus hindustanus]
MTTVEASVVVPLDLDRTWDLFHGDEMRRYVALSNITVAVENYQLRPDGTPRYTLVRKIGPVLLRQTADHTVYEPPHHAEHQVLDSPLGGTYVVDHEATAGGTRVRHRWEIRSSNPTVAQILPAAAPLLGRVLHEDLKLVARRAVSGGPAGYQPPAWWERTLMTPLARLLVGRLGRDFDDTQLLCVPGRRTGRLRSTPLKVVRLGEDRYVVSRRGESDWVRNLRAEPEAELRVGSRIEHVHAVEVPPPQAVPVLREYVRGAVLASTPALLGVASPDAPDADFLRSAGEHPVFRLDPRR